MTLSASVLMVTRGGTGWDAYLAGWGTQTRRPEQLVVVIDRPTCEDERNALRSSHGDVDFVFNECNIGLTRSLNRGLEHVRADVVFRIDDDDEVLPTRVEKQLDAFERTRADIVCTWAEGFVPDGDETPWLIRAPTADADIKQALARRNVLVHSTLAFRRDAVTAIGGYDPTFRYAQDYALYLQAIREGLTFAVVPEPLVRRSYPATSITVAKRRNQLMFSAAARIVHCAESGDVRRFLETFAEYAALAAVPAWARRLKRTVSAVTGRGA